MDILGDISGIRTSQLEKLEELTKHKTNRFELIDTLILEGIADLSYKWNKEIAIYISRSGTTVAAAIGHHSSVKLPPFKARSMGKLRCIHTHPSGDPRLSPTDISALELLQLESIAALGVKEGKPIGIQLAYHTEGDYPPLVQNLSLEELYNFNYIVNLEYAKKLNPTKSSKAISSPAINSNLKERAFLVGLIEGTDQNDNLNELIELTKTAGLEVVGETVQAKKYGTSHSYVGRGKLEEICQRIQQSKANVLICDDELTPAQVRTLEQVTGTKILDRSTLILDIFAQRARSREGKLQVELAQLQHLLPLLSGQSIGLSRLGGGVGTRGPGETKLETDRRRVRQRISVLEKELSEVRKDRETQRRQRVKSGLPLVALVGYTNAGKTTFLSRAIEARGSTDSILGENKLFATLDPIVRRVSINPQTEILLSDTVGFIQKLPHQLLRAFLATLEEVKNADILLHILDATHPKALEHADTVRNVLVQLGCEEKPTITVLNKIDKASNETDIQRLSQQLSTPIPISLTRGDSLGPIWAKIIEILYTLNH